MLASALAWARRGFRVFPLPAGAKGPPFWEGWPDFATTDPEQIRAWWTDTLTGYAQPHNIGVCTTGLCVVDLDCKHGIDGRANFEAMGGVFDTLCVRTPTGGYHLYYNPGAQVVTNSTGRIAPGIDVRGFHGYVVAPGSLRCEGAYELLFDAPVADLPDWLAAKVKPPVERSTAPPMVELDLETSIASARAWLAKAAPAIADGTGEGRTLQVAYELRDRGVSEPMALDLMLEDWNGRCSPPWEVEELRAKVANGYRYPQNPAGVKAPAALFGGVVIEPPPESQAATRDPFRAPEFSEVALADRFAELHADRLRFVAAAGTWREWTGQVWRPDATLHAHDLARDVCEQASAECASAVRVARQIASAKTVSAVERLARADRRIAATLDQWDSDPWLLNTPGGVVDLRTGEVHPHDAQRHMTRTTAASLGGACPRWLAFLARITGEDAELQGFLQRVAGYCLTGTTREHALFFGYGTGANGKSTFVGTLAAILGDYAVTASAATFTASPSEQHPTDLAMLMGARLVSVQETEQGRPWAEARIKAVTGGDPISARFMRQDFFQFVPTFKLVVAGNHKPILHAVDEAMRRRMHLIPFAVEIPPEERDTELPDRLRAEWPGILAWAVAGCLAWQGQGLRAPGAVKAATDEYLAGEDALGQWLAECCILRPREYALSASLFASWDRWCHQAGERAGSLKAFSQALAARRFIPRRQGGTGRTGFDGIGLREWNGVQVTADSDPVL
ncbi:MAG: hypothetical protein HIU82_13945 [Proteobacteria bacterium]|nr:hypothetical protein [Pseudomonadota bacterium]